MAISFCGAATAKMSKFDQCVLLLLNASCNTAIDRGAPPDLQSQGADACFVGRGIAPKNSKEKKKFETWIEKRNLQKNAEQSNAIQKCIATPAALNSCTVPLIVATRNYYPACKEAIASSEKKRQKKKAAAKN
jgi:hypothetical protein